VISYDECMSAIDELLVHNRSYVKTHGHRELPTVPQLHLAVLTCMDSRLDLFGALGLDLGEAHLIRNAGGIASDDAVRSLLLSQRLLGTQTVMVIHHTRCGLESFDEDSMQDEITNAVGARPPFRLGAYDDVDEDVRSTVTTLRESPFVDNTEIRGFVFDVDDGELREVVTP
jgi:carbonic anhydrase